MDATIEKTIVLLFTKAKMPIDEIVEKTRLPAKAVYALLKKTHTD